MKTEEQIVERLNELFEDLKNNQNYDNEFTNEEVINRQIYLLQWILR